VTNEGQNFRSLGFRHEVKLFPYSAPSPANFPTIESLFYPVSGVINIHYSDVFNSVEYINIDIFSVIKPV